MEISVTFISALTVAIIGLFGQFWISNRKFIPTIREERAKVYADFLSASLIGMRASIMMNDLNERRKVKATPISVEDRKMHDYLLDEQIRYDDQINATYACMQIMSPKKISKIGDQLNKTIKGYSEENKTKEEMSAAYGKFVQIVHEDLESLQAQSVSLRSIFSNKIKEI